MRHSIPVSSLPTTSQDLSTGVSVAFSLLSDPLSPSSLASSLTFVKPIDAPILPLKVSKKEKNLH